MNPCPSAGLQTIQLTASHFKIKLDMCMEGVSSVRIGLSMSSVRYVESSIPGFGYRGNSH